MLHDIFTRASREVSLLFLIGVLSIVLSILLVVDGSTRVASMRIYVTQPTLEADAILGIFISVCELAFGAVWLSLSSKVLRDASYLANKYLKHSARKTIENLPEDEGRSMTAALIMDLVGTYRTHYGRLIAAPFIAIVVSSLVILGSLYLVLSNLISLAEALFGWTINASVLLVISGLYIVTHKKWGRKLLRLETDQERFREFLGDSLETKKNDF
jgi:hypothetical protein